MKKDKLLFAAEKARQGDNIFHAGVKIVIIAACFLSDGITYWSLFDGMLNQNRWLNYFMAILSAVAVDLFPILINTFRYKAAARHDVMTPLEKGTLLGFGVSFVVVLAVTFVIRVSSAGILFGVVLERTRDASKISYSMGEISTAILLGLFPLFTSLIVYGLTYQNPQEAYVGNLKLMQDQLQERIRVLERNSELIQTELDSSHMEEEDDIRYQNALQTMAHISRYCKIIARKELAQKMGTPLTATLLLEENVLASEISSLLEEHTCEEIKTEDKKGEQ